jgi:hypothetical protein
VRRTPGNLNEGLGGEEDGGGYLRDEIDILQNPSEGDFTSGPVRAQNTNLEREITVRKYLSRSKVYHGQHGNVERRMTSENRRCEPHNNPP